MTLLEKVRGYRMPKAAQDLLTAQPPLIIAGITASGKSVVTRYMVSSSDYRQVISHTTRQPRSGEIAGQSYYFVNQDEMSKMIDAEAMIEVNAVHGETVYGTTVAAYQAVVFSGHQPLLSIDVQGAEQISRYLPNLRAVFLIPPSFEVWMDWLAKRGRLSHTDRQRRLRSAKDELQTVLNSKFLFLLVNREIAQTARQIQGGLHDMSTQPANRQSAEALLDDLKTT